MIFWGETIDSEKILLGKADKISIQKDRNVPADSLSAIFYGENEFPELVYIYAYEDKELVFAGIVDEQSVKVDKSTVEIKLYARSLAALLIDNEAMPQTLKNPSIKTISKLLVKPFGFTGIIGSDSQLKGEFEIKKGESCYTVADRYIKRFLGTQMYVSTQGVVYSYEPEEETVFLDDIVSSEETILQYKKLSKVIAQSGSGAYESEFKGTSIIPRVRYMALGDAVSAPQRISIAERDSKVIRVTCIGNKLMPVYTRVSLMTPLGKQLENLEIESIKYSLTNNEELTSFTLKIPETV